MKLVLLLAVINDIMVVNSDNNSSLNLRQKDIDKLLVLQAATRFTSPGIVELARV